MSTTTSRRKFIKKAAGVGAGMLIAPTLPLTAKSYRRILGANDRIMVGAIGVGGMGTAHLEALLGMSDSDNVSLAAVCDVWDKRKDKAAALTKAKGYRDYERVLENKDIDYVLIATQEHWHHKIILEAMDAGKHVYTEKPMTHTIKEAQEVVKAVNASGLKLQVGVQGMSDDSYITARKYIEDGVLGKVQMAQIDYSRNGDMWQYEIDKDANPNTNLDWEKWLGPAPKTAWDPKRYFQWRRYWDYSGGIATDLFIHRLSRILKACNLGLPKYVSGSGGHYFFEGANKAEVPDTFNMMLDYPEGMTVMLVSAQKNNTPITHMIRGDKATLTFTRDGFQIVPQEVAGSLSSQSGKKLPLDAKGVLVHKKTGAEDITLHHRNLQNAIRKGESLNCDAKLGYYGMAACKMGVLSFRKRQYLKWDEKKQKPVKA